MQALSRAFIACLLLVTNGQTSYAAEWQIDPTLNFGVGYDDNLRLSTDNEISSSKATFSPGAVFSVATPTSSASGTIRFNFRRFEKDSSLDDNNSYFEINTFHTMERTRLGLAFGFTKDTTLDSQLEATGLAFDRKRRQSITANPNWTYNLNERTSMNASYSYTDVKYLNSDDLRFVNYSLNSVQTSLTRVMNERTTASVTLSGSQTDSDNDVQSTTINLQSGASYQFSETLSASLFVGLRRTDSDFSQTSRILILSGNSIIGFIPQTQAVSNSSSGSTFNASITKTFLRGEISLTGSRNISNDFNGLPIEVTRISSDGLYRLNKILTVSLNLQFYDSKSDSDITSSLNRNYYQIEPTFTWALKKFWSLSGSYRYRRQTFDDIKSDATQNAAYLTLTYLWPRIAVSR